jgi:thiamine-phosphate pyrophosphorylase
MHRRQPPPRLWLMTDERQGEALWTSLERLPRGGGIVFRHYRCPPRQRRLLFERVKRVARRRHCLLLLAGSPKLARAWGADGSHDSRLRPGLVSAPAHDLAELRAAERAGASLVFLSPLFATRSHPGGRPLGRARFGLIARQARVPVVALGGVDERNGAGVGRLGAYGRAGIDAWSDG